MSSIASRLDAAEPIGTNGINYEEPKLLTGKIYETGSNPPRLLFNFRRTATRVDSGIEVLREYTSSTGSLAAREKVLYRHGGLVSFSLEELQSGATGKVIIEPDPRHVERQQLRFNYTKGTGAKQETNTEKLQPDTLVNDMLPDFLVSHLGELMDGATVKFRFIVMQRLETIGFKLIKESETTFHGKPVVLVRMEPTSLVIAQLVAPVRFTVEKEGKHRILQYVGRITPMIHKGSKWADLDAKSVFDWE